MKNSISKIDYINRDCHHKQSNHKTCQGCLDKEGRAQSKGFRFALCHYPYLLQCYGKQRHGGLGDSAGSP